MKEVFTCQEVFEVLMQACLPAFVIPNSTPNSRPPSVRKTARPLPINWTAFWSGNSKSKTQSKAILFPEHDANLPLPPPAGDNKGVLHAGAPPPPRVPFRVADENGFGVVPR